MKWEMEVEAALEKIWDLHDKISDAIHGISRAHFLTSIKTMGKAAAEASAKPNAGFGEDGGRKGRCGFVFVKELGVYIDNAAIAEARSLNAIRTALENLEDQLEFFHTVQSHQRAERDAAIARLEQSRIILAVRLADHHGKNYRVIEEALAFVGDVHNAGHFGAPENLSEKARSQSSENMEVNGNKRENILMQMLASGITIAKKSIRFNGIGDILGNATLFAVSMLAIFQLHQVAFKSDLLDASMQEQASRMSVRTSGCRNESSSYDKDMEDLDVLSARG